MQDPLKICYVGLSRMAHQRQGSSGRQSLTALIRAIRQLRGKIAGPDKTRDVGWLMVRLSRGILAGASVGSRVLAWGYTLQWISQLASLIRHQEMMRQADAASSRSLRAVRHAMEIIENTYQDRLRVPSVAQRVHLSPYYFARVFKRATGLSPMQYVNRRRIERAKELLADGDRKLAVIAQQVGLNNAYYFSSVFKKIEGVSPLAYRRCLREVGVLYP